MCAIFDSCDELFPRKCQESISISASLPVGILNTFNFITLLLQCPCFNDMFGFYKSFVVVVVDAIARIVTNNCLKITGHSLLNIWRAIYATPRNTNVGKLQFY